MYSPWRRYAQSSLETMLSIYLAKLAKLLTVSEFFLFALVVLSQKYFFYSVRRHCMPRTCKGLKARQAVMRFFLTPLQGLCICETRE